MSAFSHAQPIAQVTTERTGAERRGQVKQPPLHAQLFWFKLTHPELATLHALIEHCSDGTTLRAALPRIAAYSKLSVRTIQRVLHGTPATPATTTRSAKRAKPGLIARGILVELAPASAEKRRPACYRFNVEALHLDPRMDRYRRADQMRWEFRNPAHQPGRALTHEIPRATASEGVLRCTWPTPEEHRRQLELAHKLLASPETTDFVRARAHAWLQQYGQPK